MAEYKALASTEDVKAALGRDLTPTEEKRVADALAQASELFREEAKLTFTPGRKTNRLSVQGGEVRLRDTPVQTVHSVSDDEGRAIDFRLLGAVVTLPRCTSAFVNVDYSFGQTAVPEIVRTTVAGMVALAFGVDGKARAGMTQFQTTAGPYNEGGTFASWAVGGQVALSPADIAVAHKLRPTKLGGTHPQRGGR